MVRRPSYGGEKKEATRRATGRDGLCCHLRETSLHAGSRSTATELQEGTHVVYMLRVIGTQGLTEEGYTKASQRWSYASM